MPELVAEERVLREWVAREPDAADVIGNAETDSSREMTTALLEAKPGAAAFLWRGRPIRWYQTELGREEFTALRPVDGPEDLLWRQVSTDGTLVGVAERLHEDGPGPLDAAGIDTDAVRKYREELSEGVSPDPLIVRTRRGATLWFVADGNHRGTAIALRMIETGRYEPQPAYVAVSANPVVKPLIDRVRGALQRLRGRSIGRRPAPLARRGTPGEDVSGAAVDSSSPDDQSGTRSE